MRQAKTFQADDEGAVLIEFTLIMVLMLVLTFSIVEFSIIMNTQNSAQKGTQAGARVASSRLVLQGVEDCGPNTSQARAGTDCLQVAGSGTWSVVCTGAGSGDCNAVGIAAVVDAVQDYYPDANPADIEIRFQGTGLGFVGKGRPVPAVTVEINNITYDYVVVSDLVALLGGQGSMSSRLNLDSAKTTIIAEDLRDGAT